MVHLVGCGPGDEKLLTIKALELIESADVIVYDRLVNQSILRFASETCDFIYVGKKPDYHIKTQEEINNILVECSRKYNNVVRLKGGDPYIFGRGGEEGEFLKTNNVDFDVVPGVSSFYSCPSNAGIPLTFRGISSSVHVFSGHLIGDDYNYKAICALGGTLVFLMSVNNLNVICNKLIDGGLSFKTPAAIIENGTCSDQRTIISCLENTADDARKNNVKSPAVFVVGDVVLKEDKLNTITGKLLFGKKILIACEKNFANRLYDAFNYYGAYSSVLPLVNISKINAPLDFNIKSFDSVVFTSKHGVKHFFDMLFENRVDIRTLANIKFYAIGSKTKEMVMSYGIVDIMVPMVYNSENLTDLIIKTSNKGERVLYPASDLSDNKMCKKLCEHGLICKQIPVYKNTLPNMASEFLKPENKWDYVVLSSSSCVTRFAELVGTDDALKIVAIGDKTAKTAHIYGYNRILVAKNAAESEIVNLIIENERAV